MTDESSTSAGDQPTRRGRREQAATSSGAASRAGSDTLSSPREGQKRRSRKARRGWLIAIAAVLVVALGGAGLFALNIWQNLNNIDRLDDALAGDYEGRPDEASADSSGNKPINILLLGSDTRESGADLMTSLGERADAIMVVHVPADRKSVQVMSIMRDSWVPIDGYGEAKVNAAYSYGSIPLMAQTLEQLIGQRIDHVAVIDFEGFKGMTDALGGVTINNPKQFESNRIKGHVFEQGEITLNGEEALAFVGERYAFIDGDYQRVRNQQLYLEALIGKILSAQTLTNPVTVSNLIASVSPYIGVDSTLTNQVMTDLALQMRDLRKADVSMFTMPTSGTGMIGGQSVVLVDWVKLEDVRAGFKNDTLGTFKG